MKKEIKTYEELLKCDGKLYSASYKGENIRGLIQIPKGKDYVVLNYNPQKIDIASYSLEVNNLWGKRSDYGLTNIIVEVEEDWKPKFGEVVEVSFNRKHWEKRIYLGEINSYIYSANYYPESIFSKVALVNLHIYNKIDVRIGFDIRKIEEPKITVTVEEARKIIAEIKGVKAENVILKRD